MLPKLLFIIVSVYLIKNCVPQQGEYKRSLKCKKHNNNRTQRPSIKIILCYSKEEHTQRTTVNKLYTLRQHREDSIYIHFLQLIFL